MFPLLSSGAVSQYPTLVTNGQGVQVIRFMDGSDQRYPTQGRMLRQWQIRLDLLNENEVAALEAFFVGQAGDYSPFVFPDPISGSNVANCRIAAPGFATAYIGPDVSSASLLVIETNG